jgi:proteic killer suppression protein
MVLQPGHNFFDRWIGNYNGLRYMTRRVIIRLTNLMAIQEFSDRETALIWAGRRSRRLPSDMQQVARRKLRMLHSAHVLADLRIPPANRLEALSGDRAGQHSIRINDQWRVCFRWVDGNAHDVQIVDYH